MLNPRRALGIVLALMTVGVIVRGAEPWTSVDQPELQAQLDKAPTLTVENVAPAACATTSWCFHLVPNPDGRTYDALQWTPTRRGTRGAWHS